MNVLLHCWWNIHFYALYLCLNIYAQCNLQPENENEKKKQKKNKTLHRTQKLYTEETKKDIYQYWGKMQEYKTQIHIKQDTHNWDKRGWKKRKTGEGIIIIIKYFVYKKGVIDWEWFSEKIW